MTTTEEHPRYQLVPGWTIQVSDPSFKAYLETEDMIRLVSASRRATIIPGMFHRGPEAQHDGSGFLDALRKEVLYSTGGPKVVRDYGATTSGRYAALVQENQSDDFAGNSTGRWGLFAFVASKKSCLYLQFYFDQESDADWAVATWGSVKEGDGGKRFGIEPPLGVAAVARSVLRDGQPVEFLYREPPDNRMGQADNGWRIFSTVREAFFTDPEHFEWAPLAEVVAVQPPLARLLPALPGVALLRDPETTHFMRLNLKPSAIVSERVFVDRRPVGYLYREPPDNADDTGWRLFAGDEDEAYTADHEHFQMIPVEVLQQLDPELERVLSSPAGSTFERSGSSKKLVQVSWWMKLSRWFRRTE